jgi:hypothetical protein
MPTNSHEAVLSTLVTTCVTASSCRRVDRRAK